MSCGDTGQQFSMFAFLDLSLGDSGGAGQSSIRVTWELIKPADSQAPLGPTGPESPGDP